MPSLVVRVLITCLIMALGVMSSVSPVQAQTSGNEVYFSIEPAQGTYQAGQIITARIYLHNVSTSVDVQSLGLRLAFSNAQLEYLGYEVPTGSLYGSSDWVDQNTSINSNPNPNASGYIAFTASDTQSVALSSKTLLMHVRFRTIKAGTATVSFQFNTPGSYTIVTGESPETDLTDQSRTAGAEYQITGSQNLPNAGLLSPVGALGIGGALVVFGVGLRWKRHTFENQDFSDQLFG